MVFGSELRLSCCLLFGAPPDKEQCATDCVANLVDRLHDVRYVARQLVKVISDRMMARDNRLPN